MTSRFLTAAAALALLLTGCDAATDLDALASEDVEDAAAAIAESVALDAGGALDDAASMAAALTTDAAVSGDGVPNRPGCQGDRVYTDAGTWLVSISCERGNPDGLFYHSFARETTWRFLDVEGTPQETPFGATTIEHDVISGTGRHLTPRFSSELESLTSDLTIRAVSDDSRAWTVPTSAMASTPSMAAEMPSARWTTPSRSTSTRSPARGAAVIAGRVPFPAPSPGCTPRR